MALSGSIETGAYQASDGTRTLVLEWSATQSGPADNYSDVSWTLRGGGTSKQGINAKNIQAQIHTHATGILWTTATKLYNGTVIANGTVRVPHNTDGTASFYLGISGYIFYYGADNERTANKTETLDTINRYYWTNINVLNPDDVEIPTNGAYFDVNWLDGDAWRDLTNEPTNPAIHKVYGSYMELYNIRPFTGYKLEKVTGATPHENNPNVYCKTITDSSEINIHLAYQTYTINYDANGGNGAPASETFTYNTGYKVSSAVPTKVGCNFLGWSTSATAASATYTPGQSWSDYASMNITLYAVWISVYEITFDGNGGTINENKISVQTATDGTKISVLPIAQKKYYEFMGWNTLADGTGEYYTEITVTDSITLYAIYKAESNCYLKTNEIYQRGIVYARKNGVYRKAIKIS